MDHRGAVRTPGGQGSARASRLGGPGLQRFGGAAQTDQSVVDAADFGDSESACARSGGLYGASTDGEFGAGAFLGLVLRSHAGLRSTGDPLIQMPKGPIGR